MRGWFSKLCQPQPATPLARGQVRLEAATGLDQSDELNLQYRDGAAERTRRFLIWLHDKNPSANWDQFLTPDFDRVRWDKVIVSMHLMEALRRHALQNINVWIELSCYAGRGTKTKIGKNFTQPHPNPVSSASRMCSMVDGRATTIVVPGNCFA